MKLLSRETKTDISHICSDNISDDKWNEIDDFPGGKRMGKYADIMLLLYRDECYDPDTYLNSILEIQIVNGSEKRKKIEVACLSQYQFVINLPK